MRFDELRFPFSNSNPSFIHVFCMYKTVACLQGLHESCETRVCTRIFSTLMSWSNENKSCMRVDES